MGDVGDVHLGGDGRMERGDAQIIPPPGVGKVPGEGGKGVVGRCTCSKIIKAHHAAVGREWTRLVVGYGAGGDGPGGGVEARLDTI